MTSAARSCHGQGMATGSWPPARFDAECRRPLPAGVGFIWEWLCCRRTVAVTRCLSHNFLVSFDLQVGHHHNFALPVSFTTGMLGKTQIGLC